VTVVPVWFESAPHAGAQLAPDCVSAQLTPWLPVSFVTVAANPCVAEVATEADVGDTVTDTTRAPLRVIVAAACFNEFEIDVAVSVTVAGFGVVAGAV